MSATVRTIIAVVLVVTAVAVFRPSSVETQGPPRINARLADLEAQVAALQSQLTALQTHIDNISPVPQNLLDLAKHVSVDPSTRNDLVGPHVIFARANVHIQNGNALTASKNGLGNFIVGYNEVLSPDEREDCWDEWCQKTLRDGSHNLVVGNDHGYSSYGGLVAGVDNIISAPFASVSAGLLNKASGSFASVSGGVANVASGSYASVSGGGSNGASGIISSVSGGGGNRASGPGASVSGGQSSTATGDGASVSGGLLNNASGIRATVSGGRGNVASGLTSTVSGGQANVAAGPYSHVP